MPLKITQKHDDLAALGMAEREADGTAKCHPEKLPDLFESALVTLQSKSIEIVEGIARIHRSILTGHPAPRSIRGEFERGELIEDLSAQLEEVAITLTDGRKRRLRRIAVAYRALIQDIGVLLSGFCETGKLNKKRYTQLSTDVLELLGLIEDTRNQLWNLLAATDELTGLLNRHALQDAYSLAMEKTRYRDHHTLLILLDVDHFKRINDTHGHDVGDAVLSDLSEKLLDAIRANDTAIRMGGEEILVIMPGIHRNSAKSSVERLRKAIVSNPPVGMGSEPVRYTVSAGFTLLSKDTLLEAAMKQADLALYAAKEGGRDRSVRFDSLIHMKS